MPLPVKKFSGGDIVVREAIQEKSKKAIQYRRFGYPDADNRIPDEKVIIKNEDGRLLPQIFNYHKNIHNYSYFSEIMKFELFDYKKEPFYGDPFYFWMEKNQFSFFELGEVKEGIKFLQDFFKARYHVLTTIEEDKVLDCNYTGSLCPKFLEIVKAKLPSKQQKTATIEDLTSEFIANLVSFYFHDWELLKESF